MAESVKEGRDKKTEDIRKTGFWFLAFTYAKGKWRLFCAVLVLAFVFWFVFYLGGVPPESYGYAYLLAVFFSAPVSGMGFHQIQKEAYGASRYIRQDKCRIEGPSQGRQPSGE